MPDSRFYSLLQAVKSQIEAHPGLSSVTVEVSRKDSLHAGDLPHVGIYLGSDSTVGGEGALNLSFIDWDLILIIEITLAGPDTKDFDQEYLEIRAAVHNALMAEPTLGLPYVMRTIPTGAVEPISNNEASAKVVSYRTGWNFHLRTSVADMAA